MFETIQKALGARKLSADEAYRKLVAETAGGKPIPSNGIDICVAAGRSVQDFETDVTTKVSLLQAEADIVRADAMQAEVDAARQEEHEAMTAHNELVKRHRKEAEEAHMRLSRANNGYRALLAKMQDLKFKARQVISKTVDPTAG